MITGNIVRNVDAERIADESITNMKFNINFEDVKVTGENVDVAYLFSTSYVSTQGKSEKEVGTLKIKGNIKTKENKSAAEEIDKTWKDKKTLPTAFAEDVINFLNFECGSRGVLLASSIGMPSPLPLSRAKLEPTQK
jgi:hypothetical protein